MKVLKIKYVQEVKDRYGRKHLYYRRAGHPRAKLEGLPGSREFAYSYQAALERRPYVNIPGMSRVDAGTFADLRAKYYASLDFRSLQPQTQKNYRRILERVNYLDPFQVRDITRARLLEIQDTGDTIGLMRRLKTLFNFAVERGFRDDSPADKIKIRGDRRPFRAWTENDIKKFMAFYPADSRQNLAIMLLLYTGARRSDIVTFGWHNIDGNVFSFTPQKGRHLKPEEGPKILYLPLHPALRQRLADLPRDAPTFILTDDAKPMSKVGFSTWFTESARDAGLPHNSSPHGLRKAASRRLAEAGASSHQIASVTGHSSLKEVERYTRSVEQAKLARSAFKLLPKNKA